MNLMTPRNITLGFYAAGLTNIGGIWLFSLFYTNGLMSALFPQVFSTFGLICIQIWGLAYLAVARSYAQVPWLSAVFALEKLAYVITWLMWLEHRGSMLPELFTQSPLTAAFYSAYGLIDLSFGLFFAAVALQSRRA